MPRSYAFLGALAVVSGAQAQTLDLTDLFATAQSVAEKGWQQTLLELAASKFFEEKPETVREAVTLPDGRADDAAYGELAASLSVGKAGGVDWRRVLDLRRQKTGWGQIAKQLGIHPGAFNKLRRQVGIGSGKSGGKGGGGARLETGPWASVLSRYYGVDQAEVEALCGKGVPLGDVALGLNASARTGKSLDDILRLKQESKSWEKAASGLGLKGEQLADPVPPKSKWQAALGEGDERATAGAGKGAGKGKGKGRGKK